MGIVKDEAKMNHGNGVLGKDDDNKNWNRTCQTC